MRAPVTLWSTLAALVTANLASPATFTVDNTGDDGPGSLRQAIRDANSIPGPDGIHFAIPGPGVHTIQPLSPLPPMKEQTHVDGYTQPGARANTRTDITDALLLIELDGQLAGPADGLTVAFVGGTVRGLVINRFDGYGIRMVPDGSGRLLSINFIDGNFIGTDPSGTVAASNTRGGVRLEDVSGNFIGHDWPGARNIISGNGGPGIVIRGGHANRVYNNFIGADSSGRPGLGNRGEGIVLSKSIANSVGGATASGNLIVSNAGFGVRVDGLASTLNRVTHNAIRANANAGIAVVEATETTILSNAIDNNGGLGIDLGDDGPTANDACDADDGANHLQNAPWLTWLGGGTVQIELDVCPHGPESYTFQLFSGPLCDASGAGEGRTLFASFTIPLGPGSPSAFTWRAAGIPTGRFISATATDAAGNTSEFSKCERIGP